MQLLEELVAIQPEPKPPGLKILTPDWTRCLKGKIIATGPDCHEVKIGDTVSFGATSGMESVFDGATIRIMRESDIDFVEEA
jgi:co-chaperonin GroES (HSP10)